MTNDREAHSPQRTEQPKRQSFWEKLSLREVFSRREQFASWDSTPFVERFNANPESLPQLKLDFLPDFESYIREFVLLQSVIRYSGYGQFGMQNSYSETVSKLCERHGERLSAQGKKPDRAVLEASVFAQFERWVMGDAPIGETMVVISPRGTLDEGYPGLNSKHYNCIYVFVKEDGPTAQFYQLRSWDTNEQLHALLGELGAAGSTEKIPLSPKAPEEHAIFSQLSILPPMEESARITQLQSLFYKNQKSWSVNPDEIFPIIDTKSLEEQVAAANAAAMAIFDNIFSGDQPQQLKTLDKTTQLDLAIQIITQSLKRWAHDSAQNYDSETQRPAMFSSSEHLVSLWQAECKKKLGLGNEAENAFLENHHKLMEIPIGSPLNQAASMLHCGIGSLVPKNLMSIQQLPMGNVDLLSTGLKNLSVGERQELQTHLARYIPITIHGETWYVTPDYLHGLGCDYDPIQQAVVGPCVDPNRPGTGRIPLRDDPEAYTQQQYQQLLGELNKVMNGEGSDAAALEGLSEQERVVAVGLFEVLSDALFEQSVGLEAAMREDYVANIDKEKAPTLHEVETDLNASRRAPTIALLYWIGEVARGKHWEKVELVAGEVKKIIPNAVFKISQLLQQLHAVAGHSLHLDQASPGLALQE